MNQDEGPVRLIEYVHAGLLLAVVAGVVFGVAFGMAMLIVIFVYKIRSAHLFVSLTVIYIKSGYVCLRGHVCVAL